MKKIRIFLQIFMILVLFPLGVSAEETQRAAAGEMQGSYREITWRIDDQGKLFVTGTGEVSEETGGDRAPWYEYRDKIISAEIKVSGMTDGSFLFKDCENLKIVNLYDSDFSALKNMRGMFNGCKSLDRIDFAGISTENVTDMGALFYDCASLKYLNIKSFSTSNVTDMFGMFMNCSALENLNVSSFDTANVTDMSYMFYGCGAASLDVSGFDTSNVQDMTLMFSNTKITSLDLRNFDTEKVTSMKSMFSATKLLRTLDISSFSTKNVKEMNSMFAGSGVERVGLGSFTSENLETMAHMFYNCASLKEVDLSGFGESSLNDMTEAFYGCKALETVKLGGLDTSRVKNMERLFFECHALKNLDIRNFDTGSVESMKEMFRECKSLETLDLSSFDTSNVTDMYGMFYDCGVKKLDISGFDTGKVVYLSAMFRGCNKLESLDVSHLSTDSAITLREMFLDCEKLTILDVSGFNTENTSLESMFSGCKRLKELDLSNFDTTGIYSLRWMFYKCESLKTLDLSSFRTDGTVHFDGMFYGCKSLKHLDLSGFDCDRYANLDEMFYGCASLRTIDISGMDELFITGNHYYDGTFTGCVSLVEIKIPTSNYMPNIALPGGAVWYTPDGEVIDQLPDNPKEPMSITRKIYVERFFGDVYENQWYTPYVQYVYEKDLMSGYFKNSIYHSCFTPEETMTRGMVVQTLYNMENQPTITDDRACRELKDVYQDWYTDAVCWAYNEGITTGYEDSKTFKVNEPVTREQLATFLYRYAGYKGYDRNQVNDLSGLKNAQKVSPYAKDAVQWAVGAGLISGIEQKKDGKVVSMDLAPQGKATRAQMAAVLQRFCTEYVPLAFFTWNGHSYGVFDNCNTWEEAQKYCESRGGYLASITSEEENEAVYDFILGNGFESAYFGLSDSAEEGTFRWVNGEVSDYHKWHPEEPGGGAAENYAMFFYLYTNGSWNDGAFKENIHDGGNAYICEWDEIFSI